jgi:hypothetical protein
VWKQEAFEDELRPTLEIAADYSFNLTLRLRFPAQKTKVSPKVFAEICM